MIQMKKADLLALGSVDLHRELAVSGSYDVVVAGGGAAGLVAAVAAGRHGARTLLVEPRSYVGGNAAVGQQILGTHTITGLRAVNGLPAEFLRRLKGLGAASDAILDARICAIVAVEPVWVKILALEMLAEAGVHVLLHSRVTDVICDGSAVCGLVMDDKRVVGCQVAIDATGDGLVGMAAGVPHELGAGNNGLVQPATLAFRMGNVDVRRGHRQLLERGHQIFHEQFVKSLSIPVESFSPWSGSFFNANVFRQEVLAAIQDGTLPADFPQHRVIWWNLPAPGEAMVSMAKVTGFDCTKPDQVSAAEQEALRLVPVLVSFLRKRIPGFEQAHLIDVAPQLGVREARRLLGDYLLTEQDVLAGAQFDDNIGLGAYYLDVHPPQGGDKTVDSMQYPLSPYGIPYRCLLPRGVDNLLVAGRCASVTARAFGSTRVIATCMVQGQAAGTAAAISANLGLTPRSVPIADIQSSLRRSGVFVAAGDADESLVF